MPKVKKIKVYIAGPITGVPDYKKHFARAEERLLYLGYEVINPAKNEGTSYKEYIDKGLVQLMQCDAVYFLNGWRKSKGALLEWQYASTVGLLMDFEKIVEARR